MKYIHIFLILGCLFTVTSSTEAAEPDFELNAPLIDMSPIPSSIVGGVVNVITGSYIESECDLMMAGATPLTIQRYFNSGSKERGTLCHGWDLNLPGQIRIRNNGTSNHPNNASVNDRGAGLMLEGSYAKSMKISREQLEYGVTNCSKGILSSRTNIKNRRLHCYRANARHCELHTESGEKLLYKRITYDSPGTFYKADRNILPSGCSILYEYDKKKRLSKVISTGRKKNVLNLIKWTYPSNFKSSPELTLSCLDGRKIRYKYKKMDRFENESEYRYYLESVISENSPDVLYQYRTNKKDAFHRLIKKSFPDNRYLKIQYYEKGQTKVNGKIFHITSSKDTRIGRVSALYAPVGKDESPVKLWTFKYDLERRHHKNKPIGGYTEVVDALGHKKLYHFSDEQRLTSVSHFLDNDELYRKEKMLWADSGDKKTFLLAKGFSDKNGMLLLRRDYKYDIKGNVLKETIRGNLTGMIADPINWSSYKSAEKYDKTYTYTSAGLVASEIEAKKTTNYQYIKGTNLLSLKLVSDENGIKERYQYIYDSNCTLVEEIIDDGHSSSMSDLTGVTERHIKKIYPTKTLPIGLPEVVEESCINFETGEAELLNRTENTYSSQGQLVNQKIYDCNNDYCYCKSWSYDLHGNLIEEIDPLGNITICKYDENNNRIFQQTPNQKFYTLYTYDCANRLIQEDRVYSDSDGHAFPYNIYSYDYMSNLVSSTDKYGNTIDYSYDEFGRLIEKRCPEILYPDGVVKRPTSKISYDCMNNPCIKIDSNGQKTQTMFTAWAKPYQIIEPDGNIIKNIYSVDGTLMQTVDVNGVVTNFSYDYKGRKTKEEHVSLEGYTSTRYFIYNSFHLLQEIDPAGIKTIYSYDAAGRKKSVKKGDTETIYMYDSLGRQSEIWEKYGPGKYRITAYEYDYLNRKVLEAALDESGACFTRTSYKYDEVGNCTHITVHGSEFDSCTETEYDAENRPLKVIEPDGSKTIYEYPQNFQNDLGQIVEVVKEIDPNGIQTIKVMDACYNVAAEEKRDALGDVIQKSLRYHDGEGNLISRVDEVLVDANLTKVVKTEFLYDAKNREIALTEAVGEECQKTTLKKYHLRGELAQIIKPDGTVLLHEYDYLGRLIDLRSSDGSIHYAYEHDLNSRVIKVSDNINNMALQRTIDDNNQMISEKIGTGLQFLYQYDPRGRVTKLILPDLTEVEYSYDAANLLEIKRRDSKKALIYKYRFNMCGKIEEIKLPNELGGINFTYDKCLRVREIKSRYWSQNIPEDGYDPCGNLLKVCQQDSAGQLISNYEYDPLYHLVAETGSAEHSYSFDSVHNRISKDGIYHSVNYLNQLTGQGEISYEYDPNGNQSKKIDIEDESIYHYDALDRLVAVISKDEKTEYLYDSFHRRLQKTIFALQNGEWIETSVCNFLYQGDKEIGALDDSGQIIEMRTLGLGNNGEIGAAVQLEVKGLTLCPLHDFRGNVVGLVDANSGKLIECYRYTSYGEEQILDSSGNNLQQAISPWRFSSKRVDPETKWVFFGRRYYDPEVGKWTTPDPLRFIDSPNVYSFVRNRPMKYLDPDGRFLADLFSKNYEQFANGITASWTRECVGEDRESINSYCCYSTKFRVGTPHDDGLALTFINGIGNNLQDSMAAAKMISDMAGGREVRGVHNATFGMVPFDLLECSFGLFGVGTDPAKLLQETWDECWADNKTHVGHFGHSQGMIHTKNTVPTYDQELRQKIDVIAIAPAAHVSKTDFGEAIHLESKRDPVPLFDKIIHYRSRGEWAPIKRLEPHPDAPWFDHFNDSPTFTEPVKAEIDFLIRNYSVFK